MTNNSLRDTSASERATRDTQRWMIPGVGVKSVGEENEMNHLHALLRRAAMFTRLRCSVSMIFPGYLSSGEEARRMRCRHLRFYESFYANRRDRAGREVSPRDGEASLYRSMISPQTARNYFREISKVTRQCIDTLCVR